MADASVSSKVLNPKAPPYDPIVSSLFVNPFQLSVPLAPFADRPPLMPTFNFPTTQPPSFFIYTPLPVTLRSGPLHPASKKLIDISLAPVPSGPRALKYQLRAGGRRFNKAVKVGNSGGNGERKWMVKATTKPATVEKHVGAERRWKNKRGEYQKILPLQDESTSVMIKNIPNKYTRELLIQTLDHHCKNENEKIKNVDCNDDKNFMSSYDFLYLPIDFTRRVNAGFAFVNFTSSEAAFRFRDAFHGRQWEHFDSPKIAEITGARIQGKQALINNCKVMDFTYGSEEDMPVWFEPARDGSSAVLSKMVTVGKFLPLCKIKSGY